ncbi:hypothetical protein HMPREF1547_03250 [Blautia sp. KLE 1732]|nr:hypothetical protein HMPREF1547_03250 [Blautia sp. KLE 1732]
MWTILCGICFPPFLQSIKQDFYVFFAEIHISSMMPLYPFLLSAPSVECHHLRMTNVMSFSEG